MSLIGYALKKAKQYYDSGTYEHAIRVAINVANNVLIPEYIMDKCISLAIMHDLIEDTRYAEFNTIPDELIIELKILSKNKMYYQEYINNIILHKSDYPEVYWVKIADIKDHLMQKETLTEELKEKYLDTLTYLL